MLEARGPHHYGLKCNHRVTPWMSENPANSQTCSWVLPEEEDKEAAQNWSICWNFLGWWCYKKKLSCQKLLCKHGVMHITHSLERSFPHQKHMLEMFKSSLWKEMFFYHNSPHLRLQIQLNVGLAVFFTCIAKLKCFLWRVLQEWKYAADKLLLHLEVPWQYPIRVFK